MKYTQYNIENTLDEMDGIRVRLGHRVLHFLSVATIFLCIGAVLLSSALGLGMFQGILDSAPDINTIHIGPTAYATKIYDREGNHIVTLVTEGSNRERASFEELPEDLVNAFVAIEDERFWLHNGIDVRSILRAVRGVVSDDDSAGGGSTITQQLLKNNVFGGGLHEGRFERYVRKFQEQYLALELENQPGMDKRMVKESILTEYLNTINLGANTLGVKVAAKRYFNKNVSDLTLSECTVIAAITKNPSALNPIRYPEKNAERRAQVLKNMEEQGYITHEQRQEALNDPVYERIQNTNTLVLEEVKPYSWFTDELTHQVVNELMVRLSISKEEATRMLYSGGLTIHTTQDPYLQSIVDEEMNNPENYDTEKFSVTWRLTIQHEDGSIVNYSEKDLIRYMREVRGMNFNGLFLKQDSAWTYIEAYKDNLIQEGDKVLGENYDAVPQPQASFVLMDPHTGEVLALSGGRGEKKQSLTLNRASNSLRQPGSTFKVLTAFAPAIDLYGATLATTYYDSEYTVDKKTFKNWYSSGFLGYQTIRDGIIYSLNIVAVRCLMETVKPENGRAYAESLGITSLVDDDVNSALALGGLTNGVSNLELAQAFSAIANGGRLNHAKFFTKIEDINGNVIVDTTKDIAEQVMKETTAYLLTDAMSQSMLPNKAFASSLSVNSTSTRSHFDGMSLAGKSGTTTNNNDIWFVGYSPYYLGCVWGGCDENQSLRDTRTDEYNGGTSYHKDIWRNIMERVHAGLPDIGFEEPEGIVEAAVCRKSGFQPIGGCYEDYRGSAVIHEKFAAGTVPTADCDVHTSWGSIKVRENDKGGYSDDRYYSRSRESGSSSSSSSSRSSQEAPAAQAPAAQEVPAVQEEPPQTEAQAEVVEGPGANIQMGEGPIMPG